MDIKIRKSAEKTTVVLESSNREWNFKEVDGDAISKNDKMTFIDLVKTLYLAGKNNDACFIESEEVK